MTSACTHRSQVARDGPALVLSSGLTAVFTLGFWAVAAHLHDAATVGRATAEIAAITLVAGFAQLNLLGVFLRFLPAAGHLARRLLLTGYVAMTVAAVIGGCVFVALGLDQGFDGGGGAVEHTVFVAAIAAQAVFVVQDGVLTAFGKATWVPVENLATTAFRFAVLLVPIAAVAQFAIAGAWFVPVFAAVLVVNGIVLRRLSNALRSRAIEPPSLPPRHELAQFIFAEYVNSLLTNAATFAPPLLVLHLVDASAAAYFNLPWLIIMTIQMLLWNVVMPFIVESARSPESARGLARQTIAIGLVLVVVGTLVLLLAAPLVLGVEGGGFAAAGTPLLRTLAVSIPFTAVIVLYSAIAVVRRRIWRLVGMNTVGVLLLFGGLLGVLPAFGIAGGGLVYLIVQAVLALLVVTSIVRWFRQAARSSTDAASALVAPRGEIVAPGPLVQASIPHNEESPR
jgi:O-antigen/teichoic acid export membrane protein